MEQNQSIRLIWHFTRHVVIGTGLFLVVGLAAVVLKYFNDWLVQLGMPTIITDVVHYLELFLFGVDVLCFAFLVLTEAYVLCREIVAEAKEPKRPARKTA